MKVVGTGTPANLTIRFEPCELELVDAELRRLRAALINEAATERERADAPGADAQEALVEVAGNEPADLRSAKQSRFRATFDNGGGTHGPTHTGGVGERDEELAEVARVLDQLYAPLPEGMHSVEIIGPTWLLASVVLNASTHALARLEDAMRRFRTPGQECSPRELSAAAATAGAWAQTLAEYHHVDNHGLADYGRRDDS